MSYSSIEIIPENSIIPHWYMYPPKGMFYDSFDSNWLQEKYKEELGKITGAINIYIHIPFCSMKCSFCTLFTSISNDYSLYKRYVDSLIQELNQVTDHLDCQSCFVSNLYIGGGTPSLLPKELLQQLLYAIQQKFKVSKNVTFAVEFAPESTTPEIAKNWRELGFNRISLGIQSFNDNILYSMNRQSNSLKNIEILKELGIIGFESINLDLIYNNNDQDFDQLNKDLTISTELVNCITIHPLAVRRKTTYKATTENSLGIEHYHRQSNYFEYAFDFLKRRGWRPTSSVTFSKANIGQPMEESEAIGVPTIGIGIGGRSYLPSLHTSSINYISKTKPTEEIIAYLEMTKSKKFPIKTFVLLDYEEQVRRKIILGIVSRGVSSGLVDEIEVNNLKNEILSVLNNLQALDLVYMDKEVYKLTDKGYCNAAKVGALLSSKKVQDIIW